MTFKLTLQQVAVVTYQAMYNFRERTKLAFSSSAGKQLMVMFAGLFFISSGYAEDGATDQSLDAWFSTKFCSFYDITEEMWKWIGLALVILALATNISFLQGALNRLDPWWTGIIGVALGTLTVWLPNIIPDWVIQSCPTL